MQIANLVKIIIKFLGIYLLYKTSVDFLTIYSPIFLNQSPLITSVHLFNLIIPILFIYVFLTKAEQLTKWIISDQEQGKIDIQKDELILILVVTLGFLSILWGMMDCLYINYSTTEATSLSSSYSFNINFQVGSFLLIIFGYFILKYRHRISTYFSIKMGEENDEDNMLK